MTSLKAALAVAALAAAAACAAPGASRGPDARAIPKPGKGPGLQADGSYLYSVSGAGMTAL